MKSKTARIKPLYCLGVLALLLVGMLLILFGGGYSILGRLFSLSPVTPPPAQDIGISPSPTPTIPPLPGWPTDVPWSPPTATQLPTPTQVASMAPLGMPPRDQQLLYYVADNHGTPEFHVIGLDAQNEKASEFRVTANLVFNNVTGLHASPDGKYLAAEIFYGEQDILLYLIERSSAKAWCPFDKDSQCLGGFWNWTSDNQLLFRPTAGNQLEDIVPGGALLLNIYTGQYSQLDLSLTSDQAYASLHHVALSADADRVAYAVTYFKEPKEISEIWTMRLNGEEKRLVREMEGVINTLSWSPVDKQLIYFYRPGTLTASSEPSELRLIGLVGTDEKLLANQTRDASDGIYGPIWSPDGRYVAFMQVDYPTIYLNNGQRLGNNIYVANITTGEITQLSTFKERHNCFPAWAPDSKSVAFISTGKLADQTHSEVRVANIDTGQVYIVSETARQYSPIAWLPSLPSQ